MKKSAQIHINLLPKDPFFSTVIGKTLRWALSAGRYVVIFTELIVIMSFIARFTLDRQVTDLNSSIEKKKQIILSYGDLEDRFRTVQEKITQYKQTEQETNIVDTFEHLSAVVPSGIVTENLSIRPTNIALTGSTFSQTAFNKFINNLQLSPHFSNINVGEIEANNDSDTGITFSIRADTKIVQKITATKKVEAEVDLLDRTQGL